MSNLESEAAIFQDRGRILVCRTNGRSLLDSIYIHPAVLVGAGAVASIIQKLEITSDICSATKSR
jgi:hypothetical protein